MQKANKVQLLNNNPVVVSQILDDSGAVLDQRIVDPADVLRDSPELAQEYFDTVAGRLKDIAKDFKADADDPQAAFDLAEELNTLASAFRNFAGVALRYSETPDPE